MLRLLILICANALVISAQTWLRADGVTDSYQLINQVLGAGAVEVPDCAHKERHITMARDDELKRQVFLFHIHVDKDNDNCSNFDRQRNEIKTSNTSPKELKGFRSETINFSWNFKLDAKFQPSHSFTHIHQLTGVGGESDTPIITISPDEGQKDLLQIIHVDSNGKRAIIGQTLLSPLQGNWIHVTEKIKCDSKGSYFVNITNVNDGSGVLSVNKPNLDMWRNGAEFVRPKWGIYRSLDRKNELRDEIVRFDSFCLDKEKNRCK